LVTKTLVAAMETRRRREWQECKRERKKEWKLLDKKNSCSWYHIK